MSSQGGGFFASKKFKKMMSKVYGLGGAVVIVGAMFKIMHWPGASAVLITGLTTEAVIFTLSAFEPLHEDPDWTLVYPELATGVHDEFDRLEDESGVLEGTVTEQLDNMLEGAKIDSDLIESLGDGLRSLSSQANKLSDISDASVATNDYVSNLQNASDRVGKLTDTYEKASSSLMGLTEDVEEGQSFGEQLQAVSQNLSALNNVYELQLKGSSDHLETTNKMYEGINELMANLHDSLDDTKRYKENMAGLSKNLTQLNTVYSNMLSAMSVNNG